jgi:3-oxoacyl-[acyl-carrier-protein] synthase III
MYGRLAFAGTGEAALSSGAVRTAQDLAVEASLAAIADAGISQRDIDGVITTSPRPTRISCSARW